MTAPPAGSEAAEASEAGVVRPFAGRLVTPDWAARVASPMLDTLGPDDRSRLLKQEPSSWLQVASTPDSAELGDPPRGLAALHHLLDAGAYDESRRGLFAYRIDDGRGVHLGVVAGVDAAAFVTGRVRGHEAVQPERVAAVMQHFAQVPAQSELVALLHPGDTDIEAITARACQTPPALDFRTADGLRQVVWRVADADADALARLLGAQPLYVADGHHRVAASLRSWEQAGRPEGTSIPCVLYPPSGLRLEAFHRRVVGPVDGSRLVTALQTGFAVTSADPAPVPGRVAVYVDQAWHTVQLPEVTIAGAPGAVGVAGLDVVRLHRDVLEPLLGIAAAGDPRVETVPATVPLSVLVERCDTDKGALFALAPPTVAQLVDVADRGEVMMAKSTFFEPKPQAGIFLQQLT